MTTDLLTAREAAEMLGVSVFTVARLAQAGDLPTAMQLPGKRGARWFHAADVETLRALQETGES